MTGKIVVAVALLVVAIDRRLVLQLRRQGIKIFEIDSEIMVGIVVLCFFGVVVAHDDEGCTGSRARFRGLHSQSQSICSAGADSREISASLSETGQSPFGRTSSIAGSRRIMISRRSRRPSEST